jgi:hypothetical protein
VVKNVLPITEVVKHAANAGFKGDALVTAVAVAKAESGFDAAAIGDEHLVDAKWGPSAGLWQIRSLKADSGTGRHRDFTRLFDPAFNARSAYAISGGGTNFNPWSVYKNGRYKQHLQEAVSVAGSGGPPAPGATAGTADGPPVLSDPSGATGEEILVALGGGPDEGNLGRVVVGGSVDFSTTEVSEMTLVIEDAGFKLTRRHGLNIGTVVDRYGLRWQAVETQVVQGPAHPHVVLRFHPAGAVRMRNSTPTPAKQISPTDYMRALAEAAGLRFVGEPSAPRDIGPATVEDTKGRITVPRLQNAWEVGDYWAGQLGYLAFEAAGTYYFGSPRYLARQGSRVQINWGGFAWPDAGPSLHPLEVPNCRAGRREFIKAGTVIESPNGTTVTYKDTLDALRDKVVTAVLEREVGLNLRPAMNVALAGVPPFDDRFLLMSRVSWDIGEQAGPVTVEAISADTLPAPARTPEDDTASRTPATGTTRSQGARIRTEERIRLFGQPGDRVRTVTFETIFGVRATVHTAIVNQFKAACADAHRSSRWRPRQIGSYAVRPIRGSSDWSLHSFGLAFDFFDTLTPSDVWGPKHAPDAAFREAFKRHGFHLGSEFTRRKDFPHIEWASAPP